MSKTLSYLGVEGTGFSCSPPLGHPRYAAPTLGGVSGIVASSLCPSEKETSLPVPPSTLCCIFQISNGSISPVFPVLGFVLPGLEVGSQSTGSQPTPVGLTGSDELCVSPQTFLELQAL